MYGYTRAIITIALVGFVFGQLCHFTFASDKELISKNRFIRSKRQVTNDNNDQSGDDKLTTFNSQSNQNLYPSLPPQAPFLPPFSTHHGPNHLGPPPRLYPDNFDVHAPSSFNHQQQHQMIAGQPVQPVLFNPVQPDVNSDRSGKFINELGSRLLSMFGIGDKRNNSSHETENSGASIEGSDQKLNQESRLQRQQQPGTGTLAIQEQGLQALKNATVLQQLNRGMYSVFSNLSNMWNSTVQQQLNLLQDRMKQEVGNSSNPIQQRLAKQVPIFFQTMVARISDAQDNLNRFWKQVSNGTNITNLTSLESQPIVARQQQQQQQQQQRPFDLFSPGSDGLLFAPPAQNQHQPQAQPFGNFLDRIQHTFGFGGSNAGDIGQPQLNGRQDSANTNNESNNQRGGLKASVVDFWHNRVEPQMAKVQGKISQVWQDLTHNGVVSPPENHMPQPVAYGGFLPNNNGLSTSESRQMDLGQEASPASIDNLLNSIDLNGPLHHHTLASQGSANRNQPEQQSDRVQQTNDLNGVGTQIQTSVINMQRDINRMWHGLTNSLQSTLANVRNVLNPRQQQQQQQPVAPSLYGPTMHGGLYGGPVIGVAQESMITRQNAAKEGSEPSSGNMQNNADPSVNEMDGKIKEISRLQRDANTVYNVIQNQQQQVQQQQQQQQRLPFTDRFRQFFQNINIAEHVPEGFRDSLSDIQLSVRDFYQNVSPWSNRNKNNDNNNSNNNSNRNDDDNKTKSKTDTSTTKASENPTNNDSTTPREIISSTTPGTVTAGATSNTEKEGETTTATASDE